LEKALNWAIAATGVRPFTLHSVRRLFGAELTFGHSLEEAAFIGGWRNLHCYLQSYAALPAGLQMPPPNEGTDELTEVGVP